MCVHWGGAERQEERILAASTLENTAQGGT